jgi:hypothetical protein
MPINDTPYNDGDVVWIVFVPAASTSSAILGCNAPAPHFT